MEDQFRADYGEQAVGPRQDFAKIADHVQQSGELGDDLVLLKPGQAMQSQVEDRLSLRFRQPVVIAMQAEIVRNAFRACRHIAGPREHLGHGAGLPGPRLQGRLGFRGRRRCLDDGDDLVDVRERDS